MGVRMHFLRVFGVLVCGCVAGCVTPAPRSSEEIMADWVSRTGEAFTEDELAALARSQQQRHSRRRAAAVYDSEADDMIVVTGSRIPEPQPAPALSPVASSENPEITNNQEAGVDEGGVIKQIGQYFVILQDGRLFAIDTNADGNGALELSSRQDVYVNQDDDAWYDEILVSGRRVIVTAYSYQYDATTISLFRLDESGDFHREQRFYIESGDYYSDTNYATRLVNGRLVMHTPIYSRDLYWDRQTRQIDLPHLRPLPENADEAGLEKSDGNDGNVTIYRPVAHFDRPMLHLISSCTLDESPECRATGVFAGGSYEFYVDTDAFFLWSVLDRAQHGEEDEAEYGQCNRETLLGRASQGVVARLDHSGARPLWARALGRPADQFAFSRHDGELRMLTRWSDDFCRPEEEREEVMSLLRLPDSRMSSRLRDVELGDYTILPTPKGWGRIRNRFSDDYLVYGASEHWGDYPPSETDRFDVANLILLPTDAPDTHQTISLSHAVIRLERLGENFVATGYVDAAGLHVSLINSAQAVADFHTRLDGDYESENRSHAFNYTIDNTGDYIIGLPTVREPENAGRWWFDSAPSDLNFMRLDETAGFSPLGRIREKPDSEHPGYSCEISCVDWYGNSRPIFSMGRTFALMGAEMAELEVSEDGVRELQRINLTEPVD